MRLKPQPYGGCHNPNYWAQAQIRSAKVDCPHPVPMEPKPAPAPMPTAFWLVPLVASRTGLRAVPLILEHYSHPQPFGLVGDVVPGLAMHHLVDLLIRLLAVKGLRPANASGRHPDIPNVPNDNGLDAPCTQRRDKSCSLLVQNVSDLPIQPGQLLPFGTKQLPMSPRTTLLSINQSR
jgi:hypothetical protein